MKKEDKISKEVQQKNSDERDLKDSSRDEERLHPDEATINLPDVKDIPGQEFIHPPALGELADTTISSDDEEGKDLFDDDSPEAGRKNNNSMHLKDKNTASENDNSTLGIP